MSHTDTQSAAARSPELAIGESPIPVSSAPSDPPIARLDTELRGLMRRIGESQSTLEESAQQQREQLRGLLKQLLDAVEAFDRALDREGEAGRFHTARQLLERVLIDQGVTQICPEPGERFDPHNHRVSDTRPEPDREVGQIAELTSVGWRWREEWLRKPSVIVSCAADDPDAPDPSGADPESTSSTKER